MDDVTTRSLHLRDCIQEYVERSYDAEPEHLWEKFPEYEVFRHQTKGEKGAWFMLIANVTYEQIGLTAEIPSATIFIAVVKCDPDLVVELVHEPGYAPAYHMNKKRWISVLLDGSISIEDVKKRIDESFRLTL